MVHAIITPTKNIERALMVITWDADERISEQFTEPTNGWVKDIKRTASGYKLTKKVCGADAEVVAKQTRWLNVTMNTPATVVIA